MTSNTAILDCGHTASAHSSITTGYGTDSEGKKLCYSCIAQIDKDYMLKNGTLGGYMTSRMNTETGKPIWEFSNWPGSLKFTIAHWEGKHNWWNVKQHYGYFQTDNGEWWIARMTSGGMTECATATRLKHQPAETRNEYAYGYRHVRNQTGIAA